MRPRPAHAARLLASAAVAAVLALSAAGGPPPAPGPARSRDNPGDAEAAIGYARALRATEQRAQAVAVLEQASIRNPNSMPLLGAYGRALPNAGAKGRQNLALVVGLQGRFAEAEKIASADLPEDEAAANVGYLRQMLAQQGDWKKKGGKYHALTPD